MQKIIKKYKEILLYGIFGLTTVGINLLIYKLFLNINMQYVFASVISYIIASIVSYYLNLFFVFKNKLLSFNKEVIRLIKYFSVRIGSIILDTVLLMVSVELFKFDKFFSKIIISVIIILVTYIFNKLILQNREVNGK